VPWVHEIVVADEAGFGGAGQAANVIAAAGAARDVPSTPDLWSIQVIAAFEGSSLAPGQSNIGGWSPGPAYIFTQTINETAADEKGTVPAATLIPRVVLHESLHRFPEMPGHTGSTFNPGDQGPLFPDSDQFGPAQDMNLSPAQIAIIEDSAGPQ
jgi:hypothetical protein